MPWQDPTILGGLDLSALYKSNIEPLVCEADLFDLALGDLSGYMDVTADYEYLKVMPVKY